MEHPTCNLCGSEASIPVYANEGWRYYAGEPFRLVRCLQCGLIYLCPRPSPDEIGAFYKEMYSCYKQSVETEKNGIIRWARRKNLSARRKAVERASQCQSGRILDVGCATGLFLNEMQQAGWETYGVEPVENAAGYARQEFGLNVFGGYFQDAPYQAEWFDVITFWDVIEHTFSPQEELMHVARLLKSGGTLIMNFPNWDSFDRCIFDSSWQGLDPPRHLYVFSQATMGQMISKAGLKVHNWQSLVSSYYAWALSVERWVQVKNRDWATRTGKVLNFPGMRYLFSPWFLITDFLKKSSLISVIARKEGK